MPPTHRPTPDWAIPAEWTDPVDLVPPARSAQFYGGDLDGVREHLDHLEALGINLLYLTPFFPARSNHRYDASTFDHVDPLLGDDDALVRLVEAAHARGIRVIGDLTSNHSGDAHEWFRAAQADPDSPERSFYYLHDDGSYESWLGVPSLPKFDWKSPELRRRFIEGPESVVARFLAPPFNLDGWRIDVANMTGRLGDEDLNESVRRTIRAHDARGEPRHDPAGRVDERRRERLPGRRVARRDDVHAVHAAAVELAATSPAARPAAASDSRSRRCRPSRAASSSRRTCASRPDSRGARASRP